MLAHPTPHPSRACCRACFGSSGVCLEPDCHCHRLAAAPPDLEALAIQQERARAIGAGAFSFARLAFLAGVREVAEAETREGIS